MSSLDREIVLKTLRGYAEVNRITEAERRARLKHLTDDQARDAFDALNDSVAEMSADEKARLAQFRLEHHLKVRQIMKLVAQSRRYEPAF
ncbi:MAG: hypothetical protein KKD28_14150 [Chloroflexi bacterium]|nr:hypothetical protein [Chloroflexota bacterium]